ncbi:ABC transporter substrate-binding protein (plasmid) [Azospirillum argentinense]|uniref:ABC transporter substrate-binding protein n=1 Tax=Azospirillum argentinense TaxID=2970906 RepID=A0A2K1FVF5_9PROT|nr:extracellular solute-binding protein [Azospirillum argentinense]PNQ96513.1 ABC transporter substrate-binding protein [Azospirillum argentinense]
MMEFSRRRLLQTGGLVGTALVTGGLAGTAFSRIASAADDPLYAAAKKEGALTLYWGSYEQQTMEAIRDAFKAKYPGIEVNLLRQASQTVYTRLRMELQSGVHECDSLGTTNMLHYTELKKIGALAPFEPVDGVHIPDAFRTLDPDKMFHVGAISLTSINFAPGKVQTPPASWQALLEDQWQGKITTGSPAFSGDVANWVVAIRRKYGDDFLRAFGKQKPKVGQSNVDTVTDILAGERVVGSGAPFSYTLTQKAAGNPIDVVAPSDDAILNLGVTGILAKAPHPNAARLFTNFLYSTEVSMILQKNYWPTLRKDVPWAEGRSLDQLKWTRNTGDDLGPEVAEGIAKWKELVR